MDKDSLISIEDVFSAYEACRKNKRSKKNVLLFDVDYENYLVDLCNEINSGFYEPSASTAFIVDKPVKREIFAASLRDRIVHHLVIQKLNPLFERIFIYDSCACRIGKGTSFGIQRLNRFMRKCSQNYLEDAYILKLDIQSFFMSIDKNILWTQLEMFISEFYLCPDQTKILELCKKIVFNNPVKDCIISGSKSDWNDLPLSKSLFNAQLFSGLPIGNLTSQIFANFYMNQFDHFIKQECAMKYYCRYVDDFVLMHQDKQLLISLIPKIRDFLKKTLKLTLHPKKIYFQHVGKGVSFIGAFIKPHRLYVHNRTKMNFIKAIEASNIEFKQQLQSFEALRSFVSRINSYLGLLSKFQSFRLRNKILSSVNVKIWSLFFLDSNLKKIVLKKL